MEKIDFTASRIQWETLKDGSRGFFPVESTCCWQAGGSGQAETYVLSAGVLAGDVYGKGSLCKIPSYYFQVIAGIHHHSILRTPMLEQDELGADSVSAHQGTFAVFKISLIRKTGLFLPDFAKLNEAADQHRRITCQLRLAAKQGNWLIEFPAKHLNLRDRDKAWQLETGPVLLPRTLSLQPCSEREAVEALAPCFVYANQNNQVEIYHDFPHPLHRRRSPAGEITQIWPGEIAFFAGLD